MENKPVTPSIYDLCAEILALLYANDDILFEDDHRDALRKVKQLSEILHPKSKAEKLYDILKKGYDDYLEQDDLFEAQEIAADLAIEYAKQEHRQLEFVRSFPWIQV